MINSYLPRFSSKSRSLCLWCHSAFAGAFILLSLFPSSCFPLYPAAANHVAGCIQDAPELLDSLQDIFVCYPVNSADFFQSSFRPAFQMLITFLYQSVSLSMSPHLKEQCSTLYTLLFFSSTLCPTFQLVAVFGHRGLLCHGNFTVHIFITVTINYWNNTSLVLELCDLFHPLSFDKYFYFVIPLTWYTHNFSLFTHKSSYCFQCVLAIAILSVHPSVCLSVTRVDQSKTVQARITKSSPWAAWKTLVSGTVKLFRNFEKGHPKRGR